jgi:hypothetical protein
MKKVTWADMTDDDPIPPYEIEETSKHGVKVKRIAYVPPHRKDKSVCSVKHNECATSVANHSTNLTEKE